MKAGRKKLRGKLYSTTIRFRKSEALEGPELQRRPQNGWALGWMDNV